MARFTLVSPIREGSRIAAAIQFGLKNARSIGQLFFFGMILVLLAVLSEFRLLTGERFIW